MRKGRHYAGVATAVLLFVMLAQWFSQQWVAPTALFWIVCIAASGCLVFAVALGIVAHRNNQAELGFVSFYFYSASILPLVHGITTPGVLYGDNAVTMNSALLAVPVGLVGLAPLLLRDHPLSRSLARRWRLWVGTLTFAVLGLVSVMLVEPQQFRDLLPGTFRWQALALLGAMGSVVAGKRHIRLAEIADRPGPLFVAYGFLSVGAASLGLTWIQPWTVGFWLVHALDIFGVFLATIGGVLVYRSHRDLTEVLAPLTAFDPHAALELGLDPIVHRFIADLEAKDRMTRDHVVRTGALTVAVAEEMKLDGAAVRRCGLVGLLHDVGKLEISDEILTKPDKLSEEEFATMRSHAAIGRRMLADSPVLSDVAQAVGAHHERVDGKGYPYGLVGSIIPIEARVTAVCDAYDAMSRTRHYRSALGAETVERALIQNAGTQWDAEIVDALLRVLARGGDTEERFQSVGRACATADVEFERGCADCVPTLHGEALVEDEELVEA